MTLTKLLDARKLSNVEAVDLMLQIAEGIRFSVRVWRIAISNQGTSLSTLQSHLLKVHHPEFAQ